MKESAFGIHIKHFCLRCKAKNADKFFVGVQPDMSGTRLKALKKLMVFLLHGSNLVNKWSGVIFLKETNFGYNQKCTKRKFLVLFQTLMPI